MEVQEHQIDGMNNKPKPYRKAKFPESDNIYLPKVFFSMLSVAQKNSGKTFNICKLFHHFEKWPLKDPEDGEIVPIRVVWFSPTTTSANNSILETLSQLDRENDIVDEYEDHKLQERIDEVETIRQEVQEYQEYLRAYKKWMKVGENKLDFDDLLTLEKHNFEHPKDVFGDMKYKKVPCTVFVFDDLAGTKAFKNGRSVLNKFLIAHRHTSGGINVIFTTQNMRSIPPILRRNMDIYELKGQYPEIPETLLYTAAIDFVLYPDKTKEDFERDYEAVERANAMKAEADAVPTTFYGVKVLDANDNEVKKLYHIFLNLDDSEEAIKAQAYIDTNPSDTELVNYFKNIKTLSWKLTNIEPQLLSENARIVLDSYTVRRVQRLSDMNLYTSDLNVDGMAYESMNNNMYGTILMSLRKDYLGVNVAADPTQTVDFIYSNTNHEFSSNWKAKPNMLQNNQYFRLYIDGGNLGHISELKIKLIVYDEVLKTQEDTDMWSDEQVISDRTHIFINSRNRLPYESASSYIVNLPNGLIYGDDKTQYRLTVNYFQVTNSWYNIQDGYNNQFQISTDNFVDSVIDFSIDIGNPSVYDLDNELQTKLKDYFTVAYNRSLNKFVFSNTTGSTLYLKVMNCGQFIGFYNDQTFEVLAGETLESEKPVNMLGDELIIMRVRGDISFENSTIENMTTAEFYPSDILFTFPVNVPPYSLITWENITQTRFTHLINSQSKSIDQFVLEGLQQARMIGSYANKVMGGRLMAHPLGQRINDITKGAQSAVGVAQGALEKAHSVEQGIRRL
ncbi:hypothetical protein GUITHDRAFT_117606 [Guillardia theta CCMP2712]|uniref:Uncharacterized protein n=1 Tax=Guillardia theta (strain CCMP2712) TaxID=905079 RepID=L1IK02_GUITC|nr:hypothetical protein GUITHDRAFT_117606 [Guillardia theta CCMP2712]EKX36249.1 hypothetical protein GUITHDRAFT_117606 [Guillardia theta CCMP2712]|eukprot:XP_005823229.1 hypothetical protein GUITHDRAFT_117606 [Guillardia theta CCMP2712]